MSAIPETILSEGTRTTVTFLPEGRVADAIIGETILQTARKSQVHIDAPCGERGRCGKCRVRITAGHVSEPTADELTLLNEEERAAGIRLSCLTHVNGPLTVEVPEASRNLAQRKATAELPRVIAPEPYTRKFCVQVARPSIDAADLRDDLTRLREAIPAIATVDLAAIRTLHSALVAGEYTVTAVLAGDRLIGVEPGDTTMAHYGVAIDIGTTSTVGYLLDLRTGKDIAVCSQPNPQAAYGGDVISRIEFSQGDQEKIEVLRKCVTSAVNDIIAGVAADAGIPETQIYEMVVVGNTCMMHLFLGIDPLSLGHAPYTPVMTHAMEVTAIDLGIHINPHGVVRSLPNIAGFVGADTVGVLASSELEKRSGVYIAVDIGTNAEVLAGLNGKVIACSTAAGPAFEGAKISQGMRAQAGAIDGVTIGQDIFIHTIDDQPAVGICGSGIIDAIGELLRVGMLDSTGRFADVDDLVDLPAPLRERLVDDGVVLAWARDAACGRDIVLTRQDVREIQLVKGAIYAGIATLLEKIGYSSEQLDGLFIAGAFGTYITKEHAQRIGLIPNIPLEKLTFLGNAAGTGAKMALISQQEYTAICAAAHRVGYIELAGDLTFSNYFMMAMTLAPGCEDM
ncbi:MAG TPA: ASKHA domain-containing protein [Armatimonadota bacterium]|nr:ASKHA domain-containing protein [Armatimonadota bacterium]